MKKLRGNGWRLFVCDWNLQAKKLHTNSFRSRGLCGKVIIKLSLLLLVVNANRRHTINTVEAIDSACTFAVAKLVHLSQRDNYLCEYVNALWAAGSPPVER